MFKKGNPGKPFGARSKRTEYLAAVGPRIPDLLNALMDRAMENDTGAAKLILDRVWPVYTQTEAEILAHIEGLHERLAKLKGLK